MRERLRIYSNGAQGRRSTRRTAIAIPLLLVLMTTVSFAEKIYKIGPGIVPPRSWKDRIQCIPTKEKAAKIEGKVD